MHPLELVLQLQLGSDEIAVLSLPSIILTLTPTHFGASPHVQKWLARVTTLMHSKYPGARWAGLCLALQTSALNKDLMVQSAQTWIGCALPTLSKNEAPPTWKASIRLLDHIFTSTMGIPEFQRQLATPNVPRFSAALINLVEQSEDRSVRHAALATLTSLIPLYPNLHRTLHPSLYSLSLRFLSGSSTSPTSSIVIDDACNLHAVLYSTGGKVGAAPLWRRSLDTALANAWFAFGALRTTFAPIAGPTFAVQPTLEGTPTDPAVLIPLSLDRLRCAIHLIQKLLAGVTSRPVLVPIGELVKLALSLLRCAPDESNEVHVDATRRAQEVAVIQDIWQLGCGLVIQLAKSLRHYLNPYLGRIVLHVAHHLEQPIPKSQQIPFLRIIPSLLGQTHALQMTILTTRLVKALLPHLSVLLESKSEAQQQLRDSSTAASKRSKKRVHAYEGDEVFRIGRQVFCPTPKDGEAVVAAMDALNHLLSNPFLDASVRTLAKRLLATLVLELPRHPPATISPDLALHGRLYARVLALCEKHVLAGPSGWVQSAAGLVVNAVHHAAGGSEMVIHVAGEARHALEVLLHPRLPPLLLSQPPLEAVGLFRSESIKKDEELQAALGVSVVADLQPVGEVVTTTSAVTALAELPIERRMSNVVPQPRSRATPEATPVASVSAASQLIARQSPVDTRTPADELPSQQVPSPVAVPVPILAQQETAVGPTSSPVLTFRSMQFQDSENEEEEMPEIDMRSDSE